MTQAQLVRPSLVQSADVIEEGHVFSSQLLAYEPGAACLMESNREEGDRTIWARRCDSRL